MAEWSAGVRASGAGRNGLGRLAFSAVAIALEAALFIGVLTWLNRCAPWIEAATRVLSLLLALGIYSRPTTSAMKMPWMTLILLAPVPGTGLYLIVGMNGAAARMRRRYDAVNARLMPALIEGEAGKAAEDLDEPLAGLSRYLIRNSGYPLYRNGGVTYFADASEGLAAQRAALSRARRFIFMEYHAIEEGEAWRGILAILEDRVRAGVEVRLLYDDLGSIGFINTDFVRRMERIGIRCRAFNPLRPGLNPFMNNRDHRKLTVVDGAVGFTGGYNLADAYFNLTHPYGRWKDTGVQITGGAVRSLTVTFLQNWNACDEETGMVDVSRYLPPADDGAAGDALVQPYADSPLDRERVGAEVYISLVNGAKRYCWFMTPYLVLTDEMIHALGLAARRGVDVRIITPGIPDKRLVYRVTRSYYNPLTRSGVRIFEWTPGFCHGKMCVVDDAAAVCGTVNLDYRSLYHHFENGCLYMRCPAVLDTRRDFEATLAQCQEVTERYTTGRDRFLRLGQMLLRLFAPLF